MRTLRKVIKNEKNLTIYTVFSATGIECTKTFRPSIGVFSRKVTRRAVQKTQEISE